MAHRVLSETTITTTKKKDAECADLWLHFNTHIHSYLHTHTHTHKKSGFASSEAEKMRE